MNKKIFFLLSIIFGLILSVNIKNGNKKFVSLNRESKECKPVDECHPCTFNELKTLEECQPTGYKKRIRCIYENKENEEQYYGEPCNENKKFNSVYIMLIICIVLFFCSYKYQKTQKDSTLKNVMVRLSILKE